jgi:glutamine synthetase
VYGANVEVKIIDPSANPYLASAAVLGLALDGIEQGRTLPAEVTVDPSSLSEAHRAQAGITVLSTDQRTVLDALDSSTTLRAILGDPVVDAVLAVRRYEQETYGHLSPEELAEKFRLAWSV